MKLTVTRKPRYKPTELDGLYKELDTLLDDYALPKCFYTNREWVRYIKERRKLLDLISDKENLS